MEMVIFVKRTAETESGSQATVIHPVKSIAAKGNSKVGASAQTTIAQPAKSFCTEANDCMAEDNTSAPWAEDAEGEQILDTGILSHSVDLSLALAPAPLATVHSDEVEGQTYLESGVRQMLRDILSSQLLRLVDVSFRRQMPYQVLPCSCHSQTLRLYLYRELKAETCPQDNANFDFDNDYHPEPNPIPDINQDFPFLQCQQLQLHLPDQIFQPAEPPDVHKPGVDQDEANAPSLVPIAFK
ncbi:hypothetical protein F4604DRAFT_1916006 [Suillus subluteus]|nr:hypothetical protein F4604DRAFT_1916006 [Suillus subluteus]